MWEIKGLNCSKKEDFAVNCKKSEWINENENILATMAY